MKAGCFSVTRRLLNPVALGDEAPGSGAASLSFAVAGSKAFHGAGRGPSESLPTFANFLKGGRRLVPVINKLCQSKQNRRPVETFLFEPRRQCGNRSRQGLVRDELVDHVKGGGGLVHGDHMASILDLRKRE